MLIYKDGQVAHYKEIFSNTSFSASGPSNEFLTENGTVKVNVFKDYDRATQKLIPADPYIEDGWCYTVVVADKTPEEIQADLDSQAAKARAQRDRLLSDTDWTQVLDAPVNRTDWAVYRQNLRDIPSQPGFPLEINWPTPPNNS
jgi:hypothetical protein